MIHDATGLLVFIVVVVLNVAGLLLDGLLLAAKQPTITDRVWERPILGLPILLVQLTGIAGLAVHFYASAENKP